MVYQYGLAISWRVYVSRKANKPAINNSNAVFPLEDNSQLAP